MRRTRAGVALAAFTMMIAVGTVSGQGGVAAADSPTITVTPDTGLGWRSPVHVELTGFDPDSTVDVYQCAAETGGPSTCSEVGSLIAIGDGTATGDFGVTRFVRGEDSSGDCWSETTTCSLRAFDGFRQVAATITFDPSTPPPPPPTMLLSAVTDFPASASVTAYGTGLFAYDRAQISQCTAPGGPDRCVPIGQATGDASGNFIVPVTVHRVLPGFPYDCVTGPVSCVVRLRPDGQVIDVPITFDPTTSVTPQISLDVSPATGLVDGEPMTIAASGFSPNRLVVAGFCRESPNSMGDCVGGASGFWGITRADGTVTVQIEAISAFATADGLVDCGDAPGRCVVAIATFGEFDEVGVLPVEFVSGAERPSVEIGDLTTTEGEGGFLTTLRIPVRLDHPAQHRVVVTVASVDGSAQTTGDYFVPVGGRTTVTILPGNSEGFVVAYILDDALNEGAERFRLHPVDAVGATIVGGDGVVTILDDDPEPLIGVGDAAARESDGVVRIPVVMPPSGRDVSFEYRTHHATARSGTDFVRTKGTATIPAGQSLVWITVPVLDDRVVESTESFTLEIRKVRHAQVSRPVATVTITDDD